MIVKGGVSTRTEKTSLNEEGELRMPREVDLT